MPINGAPTAPSLSSLCDCLLIFIGKACAFTGLPVGSPKRGAGSDLSQDLKQATSNGRALPGLGVRALGSQAVHWAPPAGPAGHSHGS